MRQRSGRGRVFSSGGAAWLGVGTLAIILTLIVKRHEESSEAVRTALRTGWERVRDPEQSARQGTDSPTEQAGQLVGAEPAGQSGAAPQFRVSGEAAGHPAVSFPTHSLH